MVEHAGAADAPEESRKPPADAPVSVEEAAENPPTRQGGADVGQTADDPGRGGD